MASTLDKEWVDLQVVKQCILQVKVGMLHRCSRPRLVHWMSNITGNSTGFRTWSPMTTSFTTLNERYPARVQQKVKFKIDFI